MNALQTLKAACSMTAQKKTVVLPDGTEFAFWMTPLTVAERQRAQKQSKSDDAIDFALQLLISKATDENAAKLFAPGTVAEIRNDLPASVIDALLLELLDSGESEGEDEEDFPKQSKSNSKKTGS